MRTLIFLLLLSPAICVAQSKQDYINKMDLFVKYYNKHQDDSICAMSPAEYNAKHGCFWKWAKPEEMYAGYGNIISHKYLGVDTADPEHVTVFKVVYEKVGTKAMSFTLNKNNDFGTFRFNTSSEEIKNMMTEK